MDAPAESTVVVPRTKSSLWKFAGNALGGWKIALASQRRQSTKLITNIVQNFEHVLDTDDNVLATTLSWFEKATHINRRYLFVGALLFIASYLSMGRGAGTLCNVLGMVYPIYASIKATEGISGYSMEHWIMYWIVYSILGLLEVLLEIFLVWLPLYYLLKFLFLSWCMVPIAANGSHVIYGSIIRPLFHQHSDAVDSALSAMAQHLTAEIPENENLRECDAGAQQESGVRQRTVNTQKEE